MRKNIAEDIVQAFLQEQQLELVTTITDGRVFHVRGTQMDLQRDMVLKLDAIDPERRPGKPKGLPRGEYLAEARRMEEAFKVMKDYRFFKLCLPAVYGMGRYEEAFDWLLMKYYDGTTFEWSENGEDSTTVGGKALTVESARDIAMMVFDLTQVPPLKMTQQVETKNYPEAVDGVKERAAAAVEAGLVDAEDVSKAVDEWNTFFEEKHAALYTIQNGDFYPRNFLQLEESILLLDWESCQITAVEEVIAYCSILMWNNPQWQERFLKELQYLLTINDEWLQHMVRYRALEQLILWVPHAGEAEEKIAPARHAMLDYWNGNYERSNLNLKST